jgi:hypothetical protein
MSGKLTSWKEIAQYIGKGVRTAQRWERLAELPVRRLNQQPSSVFAFTEEIDRWMHAQAFNGGGELHPGNHAADAEKLTLQAENQALKRQIAELRTELESLRHELKKRLFAGNNSPTAVEANDLFARCEILLRKSEKTRLDTAELLDLSRNLSVLRRYQKPSWRSAR